MQHIGLYVLRNIIDIGPYILKLSENVAGVWFL